MPGAQRRDSDAGVNQPPPPLEGVLETVLYYASAEEEVERFYRDVLGMRPIGKVPGRYLFFRAGRSVFLLFDAEASRRPPVAPGEAAGVAPPHGAQGAGHTCLQAAPGEYARWKAHLEGNGVAIISELTWPKGRSFYFPDPAGNVLEIAETDIWPA